jgi:hypothetical protein
MVFKSVNDLLERTYCIIERIHFAGPSAARTGFTVAASLEKTRTYLTYLVPIVFEVEGLPVYETALLTERL